jgi:hypothetical protein
VVALAFLIRLFPAFIFRKGVERLGILPLGDFHNRGNEFLRNGESGKSVETTREKLSHE